MSHLNDLIQFKHHEYSEELTSMVTSDRQLSVLEAEAQARPHTCGSRGGMLLMRDGVVIGWLQLPAVRNKRVRDLLVFAAKDADAQASGLGLGSVPAFSLALSTAFSGFLFT
ncbi:hypothetical protein JVT61DRAFT_14567 [Boletus reticuloceps]|uniref:Uncharacterized protein n=1 Tax=Boletus reticuloceps TaxID=495285 RepID=A0A8I2YRM1_9AGAM|nr:hypothetical protein JVT61DRAFT_14567 [Boletus reticuloceps]